jgi:hypothetical protein
MKKILIARVLLVIVLFMSLTFLFMWTSIAYGQTQPTIIPPTQAATATVSPSSQQQQRDELIQTYKEVLDVSKSTVEEVHNTANFILTIVGVIFVALSAVGTGAAWLLSTFAQRASDKATIAQQKAAESLDIIQRTEAKTLEIEKRNGIATFEAGELAQRQNDLRIQIEDSQNLFQALQSEMNQFKSDRKELKRPLILMLIDDYGMQLLSGNIDEKNNSISALIELSTRLDAVVRRRSIKTLGIREQYDERVEKRLKEIIESDPAHGVRKEAEKSLRLIESQKPKKIFGRKL